ncbi:MAG: 4-hydroxy-3-methylbut-2-enyl diphosphate reductase [Alphaproteobacteria bacterium]|nr:4-hydroxy-3-methylbut-2-enyl diphosphate reductase [Alphaproteobacteria bacterium]
MGSTEQTGGSPPKPPIKLVLAAPRGFCAGVERAIRIVEMALEKFGPPVYVRHEIVHNRRVVRDLEGRGAVFIDELDQVPDGAKVIFSAHGVPKWVPEEAVRRKLYFLNATCPLVSKVHVEAEHHYAAGRHIVLIGHAGHPEVAGTLGQLPQGAISLVETAVDIAALSPPDPDRMAYVTQTTLSVDDTSLLVSALRLRFPGIVGPRKQDICYATTNRQEAVKSISARSDLVLVLGSPNSSNTVRLVEVARRAGVKRAMLIEGADAIDWTLVDAAVVGISAGASSPESLVDEVVTAFRSRYDVELEEATVTREDLTFNLPRALAS